MKKIIYAVTAISLFLFSCGNTLNEKSRSGNGEVAQEEHQHHDDLETIELNNGEKWRVDTNMITHIRNMEKDIHAFAIAEAKEYNLLAKKLQANIDLLTSNCTMQGKAHDELHKWLLPYIDLVQALAETKTELAATRQFEKIQTSFITFNQYFI